MKTIIKDLTGEMPVDESLHDNIANVLRRFDECTTTSRYGDAIESLIALFADKPKGKPIEFVMYLTNSGKSVLDSSKPKEFAEIRLISRKDKENDYDLFEAIFENGDMFRHLGHWNDGYVEGNDN